MLTHLSISNFVLIENLEVDFPSGLTIISGETGAGKSILLGALSLLLGERAGADRLKESDKNCVIEAEFTLAPSSTLAQILKELDIELSNEITIRKVITPSGRGRSFVNDEPVNSRALKEIAKELVDIHTQHEQLLLSDSNFRLDVLDSFASNGALLEKYRASWEEVKRVESTLKEQQQLLAKEEQEYEYNKFQFQELESAKLQPDELEELEAELTLLSNIEEIKSSLYGVEQLLNSGEASTVQTLREVENLLNRVAPSFERGAQLAKRVESCRIELAEIERENQLLAEGVDADPNRLQLVEERVSLIYSLLQKHRVKEVKQLIELKEQFAAKIDSSEHYKQTITKLERELKEQRELLTNNATQLSKSRRDASSRFSKSVEQRVRELEMPHAKFRAQLTNIGSYTPQGAEGVQFLFSANKEIGERELSKVASGGELSRVMLCLKTILAKKSAMPTLILDEIDSGVSGSVADKMGSLIGELSHSMQLIAITHLPQIASKGESHLLVYKEYTPSGSSVTKIKELSGKERVKEIARMLSGTELTPAAIANAIEFLDREKF